MNFIQAKHQDEEKKKAVRAEKNAKWLPIQKFWLLYVVLIGTAILSAFAGVYIGLAPDNSGTITWTSSFDLIRRIFFAAFYMISFVTTAEGATLYWETKLVYHDVDERGIKNDTQIKTARIALIVSVATIVLTGLASARFLSAWLGALAAFSSVPVAAQGYVVWSIPILFVFHAVASIVYWYYSADSALERWKSQVRRQTQAEMHQKEADAWKEEYTRLAPRLAETKGRRLARAAVSDDFYSKEEQYGTDMDGDGYVGRPPTQPIQPPFPTQPMPPPVPTQESEEPRSF